MYFPMLVIATKSDWGKKKKPMEWTPKAYMPTMKSRLLTTTLKRLQKDIKDVMCNIAQVDQISGMLLIWPLHI